MADDSSFLTGTVPGFTNPGDKLDPERLKYITENFKGLQGLTSIAMGLLLTCSRIIVVFESPWVFLSGVAVSVVLAIAALKYLPGYYARRFGFVQQRPWSKAWTLNTRQVAFYIVILIGFGLILMEMEHAIRPHIDLLTFLMTIAVSFAVVPRAQGLQRPTSLISLVIAVNLVLAVVALLPLWVELDANQVVIWKLINAATPGIVLIPVGISDHLALTRLLPGRAAEDDHE